MTQEPLPRRSLARSPAPAPRSAEGGHLKRLREEPHQHLRGIMDIALVRTVPSSQSQTSSLTPQQPAHHLPHLPRSPFQNSKCPPHRREPRADQGRHMIEGLDNDDRYRMVEDEFFAMAGMFTAYLHRAEYQRLKNQAKSQNAETIANISRPVVGSLTEIARKRQEDVLRRRKQQEALKRVRGDAGIQDHSADEDDAPWTGTALQGLMDNSRKEEVPLTRLVWGPPTAINRPSFTHRNQHRSEPTRATALASPSPRLNGGRRPLATQGQKRSLDETETESDDDDDLGAGIPGRVQVPTAGSRAAQPTHATPVTRHPQSTAATKDTAPRVSHSAPRRRVTESMSTPSKALSSPAVKEASDSEDSDPFTIFKDRRRREKDRKRPTKAEKKDQDPKIPDIIPTFLL